MDENLWPQELGTVSLRAPSAILREQATALGQKTRNIVTGSVTLARNEIDSEIVAYNFILKASSLGNYRHRLLTISHKLTEIYPVNILNTGIQEETDPEEPWVKEKTWKCRNEGEFKAALKEIFTNKRTLDMINAMIAQSQGISEEEAIE